MYARTGSFEGSRKAENADGKQSHLVDRQIRIFCCETALGALALDVLLRLDKGRNDIEVLSTEQRSESNPPFAERNLSSGHATADGRGLQPLT